MHEMSLVSCLMSILEDTRKKKKYITSFLAINITINPYSCINEESLNFAFSVMCRGNQVYSRARILVSRSGDPVSREFLLDSVEVEINEEGQNDTGRRKHL